MHYVRFEKRHGKLRLKWRSDMKNIDRIRSMSEEELTELLYGIPFDCAEKCPDFENGCLGTCTHDAGRDFIRDWLNEEN